MSENDDAGAESEQNDSVSLTYATPQSQTVEHATPLTRYDFATLAVRLLGLYLLIEALPIAINVFSRSIMSRRIDVMYGYNILAILTYAGTGALLVAFAPRIGAKILPALGPHDPARSQSPSSVQLHGAAIATCGIILAAYRGIPGLILDIWAYYNRPGSRTTELLAQHVIETLLGIFLFFGASAIANYWDRTRRQEPP